MKHLTRISDSLGDTPYILEYLIALYPSDYSLHLFFPLVSSYHNLISVSCPLAQIKAVIVALCPRWEKRRTFLFSGFSLNEYCFQEWEPSLCTQRIVKVIVSGTKAHIPHIFSLPSGNKLWFNHTSSSAIKDKDVVHER